jgi:hypothetical protein
MPVHVEVLRADELPAGIPARRSTTAIELAAPPKPRGQHRPFRDKHLAAEAGRKGALAAHAKARQLKALEGLGLRGATAGALAPYLADAEAFAVAECERLATCVGGGVCGSAPASIIQSAALALAGSRYLYSAGELSAASRLAESSRQHLLAAHELCAREAKARLAGDDDNSLDAIRRRINGNP